MLGFVVNDRRADLLLVIRALGLSGFLNGSLNRWQQHGRQHADDGDHHQQLDQRNAWPGNAVFIPISHAACVVCG